MTMFFRNCRIALESLRGYKLQSSLSTIGLMLAAACLVFMMALSFGVKKETARQLESLGGNVIIILPGQVSGRGQPSGNQECLTPNDAKKVSQIMGVKEVSVGTRNNMEVGYRGIVIQSEISGISPTFLSIRKWELEHGRFISDIDVRSFNNVCVIGKTIQDELFFGRNPVGEFLLINGKNFKVVGALLSKGFLSSGKDQDNAIFIPFTTAQKRLLGQDHIGFILASACDEEAIPFAIERIKLSLRESHNLKDYEKDDFTLMNQSEIGKTTSTMNRTIGIFLGITSFIALICGSVGIIIVLIASTTERRREIGLRMSLGARQSDISLQFFLEGTIISLRGAGIGVIFGAVTGFIIGIFLSWPMYVSPVFAITCWLSCASIGIISSYWPARRASRLNPIDALKYE